MKYEVKRNDKVLKTFTSQSKAEKYFLALRGRAKSGAYVEAVKPKSKALELPKTRKYRKATLERVQAIVNRGAETPRYLLIAIDAKGNKIAVANTRTVKSAKYLRRKARGFTRRVLLAPYKFRIVRASHAA